MTSSRRFAAVCFLGLSLTIAGCAGSPLGASLQRSLEADSQLAENPPFGQRDTAASTPTDSDAGSTPSAAEGAETGSSPRPADSGASPNRPDASAQPESAAELAQVPEELRPYVGDLVALELLATTPAPGSDNAASSGNFQPNQIITRSDYARWLLTVNNRFYADQSDKRIRAGVSSATPAFKDVPPSHPDFEAIQGLAEAGLIPSALAGNSTAVNFRPEDPLTRKDLILWKVPLDTRQGLPTTTPEAVKERWGFQDAGKIEPLALRAVIADYQNGEFANIRRAFGYTTLFQPDKGVTQAEAAAVLWRFGSQTEGISAAQVRQGDTAPAASAEPPESERNRTQQPTSSR